MVISLLTAAPTVLILLQVLRAAAGDADLMRQLLAGTLPAAAVPTWMLIASNIATTAQFALRAVMATIANHLYRSHTMRSIARIKEHCGDPLYYRYALSKQGGVSVLFVLVYVGILLFAAVGGTILLTQLL